LRQSINSRKRLFKKHIQISSGEIEFYDKCLSYSS
jgi:hypothetical protein